MKLRDWAEVHRLFHREGLSKTRVTERLGMSRNKVDRLLSLDEPPSDRQHPLGIGGNPVGRSWIRLEAVGNVSAGNAGERA